MNSFIQVSSYLMSQDLYNIAILNFPNRRERVCIFQFLPIKVETQILFTWVITWSIIVKDLSQRRTRFYFINHLLIMLILYLDADFLIVWLCDCWLNVLMITWHFNTIIRYNNGGYESITSAVFRNLWHAFCNMYSINCGGNCFIARYHCFLYTHFWCDIDHYCVCA